MEVSIKSVFQGVFLFIILALCINLYALSVDLFLYGDYIQSIGIRHIYGIEIFTAIYSVLNGFYEEIFFLESAWLLSLIILNGLFFFLC